MRRDRYGGIYSERTPEYGETPQDDTLGIRQKLVAPLERRPQGLMSRSRRSAAAG
jgi:hypothetical protein